MARGMGGEGCFGPVAQGIGSVARPPEFELQLWGSAYPSSFSPSGRSPGVFLSCGGHYPAQPITVQPRAKQKARIAPGLMHWYMAG